MLVDLDPFVFVLNGWGVRWYGLFMAISVGFGVIYFILQGRSQNLDEDHLYTMATFAVLGGIIGARLVYVATNPEAYLANPAEIIRIDRGGLSFHGAIGGGFIAGWLYARHYRLPFSQLADLAVPGIALGIVLVRIGNVFNQEALGREAALFVFERHPTQLYGSAIGVVILIIYFMQARYAPPAGYQFWSFVFWYQALRGLVEETFRENPLYAWGYVHEGLGMGFFTLTHLVTPIIVLVAWWMMQRSLGREPGARSRGARAS